MDVPLVSAREIGRRIGISATTSWRWSRQMRYGPPADARLGWWLWKDDSELSDRLKLLSTGKRKSATCVWKIRQQGEHLERLGKFAVGDLVSDTEDLEMASVLLNIAERRWRRRADGLRSPACVSAEVAAARLLTKTYATDETAPTTFSTISQALAARAGNTMSAGGQ